VGKMKIEKNKIKITNTLTDDFHMGQAEAEVIADSLKKNPNLTSITISLNEILSLLSFLLKKKRSLFVS